MQEQQMKRSTKITASQQRAMLEYLSAHPELTSGKFTSTFTHKNAQNLWQELTKLLNAIPGAQKTWNQWRKTWQDKRNKTRTKKAKINSHRRATGGGEATKDVLTTEEENVLTLISPTSVEGHLDIAESDTTFNHDFIATLGNAVEVMYDNSPAEPAAPLDSGALQVHQEASITYEPAKYSHISAFAEQLSTSYTRTSPATSNVSIVEDEDAAGTHQPNLTMVVNQCTPLKNKGKKRHVAVQRLHQSVEISAALADAVKTQNTTLDTYYKKKLHLLQQQTAAFQRMAAALEGLAGIHELNK